MGLARVHVVYVDNNLFIYFNFIIINIIYRSNCTFR